MTSSTNGSSRYKSNCSCSSASWNDALISGTRLFGILVVLRDGIHQVRTGWCLLYRINSDGRKWLRWTPPAGILADAERLLGWSMPCRGSSCTAADSRCDECSEEDKLEDDSRSIHGGVLFVVGRKDRLVWRCVERYGELRLCLRCRQLWAEWWLMQPHQPLTSSEWKAFQAVVVSPTESTELDAFVESPTVRKWRVGMFSHRREMRSRCGPESEDSQ